MRLTAARVAAAALVLLLPAVGGPARADPVIRYEPLGFARAGYDYAPAVVWDGRQWVMYHCGLNTGADGYKSDGIFRSTSPDGVTWSGTQAVLTVGAPGAWDDRHVCDPTVIADAGIEGYRWAMWYTGIGDRTSVSHGPNKIGLALSNDGVHWTKYGDNAVIDCGINPDAYGCLAPSVVKDGDTFVLGHVDMPCDDYTCRLNRVETSPDGLHWTDVATFSLPDSSVGPDLLLGSSGTWYLVSPGDTSCGRSDAAFASELVVYETPSLTGEAPRRTTCLAYGDMGGAGRFIAEAGFYRDALGHQPGGTNELRIAFGLASEELHGETEEIRGARLSLSGVPSWAVQRVSGPSRIGTAIALSQRSFGRATDAVLARADSYADALAGAPLAAKLGAPMLLTGTGALDADTAGELSRLGVRRAHLLGGPAALSNQVEADLRGRGITEVSRAGGANRFDTARAIAAQVGAGKVFVVQGGAANPSVGWPDAVSVSALASHLRAAILLVNRDQVPPETMAALQALRPQSVTIVGGPAAVPDAVAGTLQGEGLAVDRVAGPSRYDTSRAVADLAIASGMSSTSTWLSTGQNWPDSLVAGPALAPGNGMLLLVDGSRPASDSPTISWVRNQRSHISWVYLVGGPAAVSPAVETQVRAVLAG